MFALVLIATASLQTPTQPLQTVGQGLLSPMTARREVVIKTSAEWQKLWSQVEPVHPAPIVDFSRRMIVGVFVGSRPSAGYRVEVFSVAHEASNLVVRYREHRPRPGTAPAEVVTSPYHLVAVPRDDRRVEFIEVRELATPQSKD